MLRIFSEPYRPNVTPNAQESEDSGLSLGYSSTDAAKRMSSSSSSINSEQDHDRDIYDEDARELRQNNGSPMDMISATGTNNYDFRYDCHGNFHSIYTQSMSRVSAGKKFTIHIHIQNWNNCSQFTRITSIEQRRQYKTEFDKDYAEYMQLHAETQQVSRRFAQLDESLRNAKHNDTRYKVRSIHFDTHIFPYRYR